MKRVVLLLGMLFSVLGVYADENVLQTIEIEPVKDTYNIVLVSDKAVDIKKTVQASNKINLTLKDIRASKTLNTVYNNVANVDTVMVEQQGGGVNIFFQAENAEAATVTFDVPAPIIPAATAPASNTKQLKLNNPIESYAPIYNEDMETAKTSGLFKRLKSNSAISGIKDTLDDTTSDDTANKFISYGLIGLFAFAVIKLFKRKEPEMKIGLAQQTASSDGQFGFPQAMQPSYQTIGSKPFTTVNYGINAYKNENRNPYETAPVQFHNPRLKSFAHTPVQQESMTQAAMVKTPVQSATATQTLQKKMTTPVNTSPVNQSNPNIDNLKFLESMTAIYEKSGRHDLARGLKASLNKNNIK